MLQFGQITTQIANWDTWKRFLGQAVEYANELGVPKERITALAQQAGDILASSVPAANQEQQTLKELWQVANEQEKQTLASLMTKLVSSR